MTLAGCIGDSGGGGDEIAIISSPAGFGDNAFTDMAVEGLENAQEDHGFDINEVEVTDESSYPDVQAETAETEPDLIVCVGFHQTVALCGSEDSTGNAEEYEDQNWMLINDPCDLPNVASYTWANHEMSYLAGVVAGTMTSQDFDVGGASTDSSASHIGFVGGEDGSLINAFEEAYKAGAQYVNDDVEISTGYVGNFSDTSQANNIATSQIEDGADIVYQAAAAAGEGAIEACHQNERYAIGVDADQSQTLPDYADVILASAVKLINEGTREVANAIYEDNFDDLTADHNLLGLEEEAVDAVIGTEFEGELPQEVHDNLDEARQGIVDGDIDVPCEASGC